jgi:pimeloyl-ACP methyl ester carboxylesterase
MATYVLVHGGWHGGWCWNRVAPLLREAGHHVLTPTMTGLGERVHLTSPQVDLALHIEDIVAVLEWEDLRHVILVGHSSAGAVISGVAQRIPQRLARLVYLDAFVLREGEGVLDLVPEAARMDLLARTEQHGQGWQVPIPPLFVLGLTEAADIEWVVPKLRPQPLQTLRQPLRGDTEVVRAIPRVRHSGQGSGMEVPRNRHGARCHGHGTHDSGRFAFEPISILVTGRLYFGTRHGREPANVAAIKWRFRKLASTIRLGAAIGSGLSCSSQRSKLVAICNLSNML